MSFPRAYTTAISTDVIAPALGLNTAQACSPGFGKEVETSPSLVGKSVLVLALVTFPYSGGVRLEGTFPYSGGTRKLLVFLMLCDRGEGVCGRDGGECGAKREGKGGG